MRYAVLICLFACGVTEARPPQAPPIPKPDQAPPMTDVVVEAPAARRCCAQCGDCCTCVNCGCDDYYQRQAVRPAVQQAQFMQPAYVPQPQPVARQFVQQPQFVPSPAPRPVPVYTPSPQPARQFVQQAQSTPLPVRQPAQPQFVQQPQPRPAPQPVRQAVAPLFALPGVRCSGSR